MFAHVCIGIEIRSRQSWVVSPERLPRDTFDLANNDHPVPYLISFTVIRTRYRRSERLRGTLGARQISATTLRASVQGGGVIGINVDEQASRLHVCVSPSQLQT